MDFVVSSVVDDREPELPDPDHRGQLRHRGGYARASASASV